MDRRSRGIGFYLLAIMMIMMLVTDWGAGAALEDLSRQAYHAAVEGDAVKSVTIKMNPEGTSGQLIVYMKESDPGALYTPDVKTELEYLESNDVTVNVTEVEGESWFTAHLLPLIIVLIIIVVFFMMMNRQAAGPGNKMSNFGKSRAKMTIDGVGNINFKKVDFPVLLSPNMTLILSNWYSHPYSPFTFNLISSMKYLLKFRANL